MSKRKDYISWDEYFMGVALLASQRSKDPSTQVGACIVNDDNRIMSVGYNGFPRAKPLIQNIRMFATQNSTRF